MLALPGSRRHQTKTANVLFAKASEIGNSRNQIRFMGDAKKKA
jgi:hypothetical protein